jgi:hypothetical protein
MVLEQRPVQHSRSAYCYAASAAGCLPASAADCAAVHVASLALCGLVMLQLSGACSRYIGAGCDQVLATGVRIQLAVRLKVPFDAAAVCWHSARCQSTHVTAASGLLRELQCCQVESLRVYWGG